jgi:hypothetical protein
MVEKDAEGRVAEANRSQQAQQRPQPQPPRQ